jgi:hypothetical protein
VSFTGTMVSLTVAMVSFTGAPLSLTGAMGSDSDAHVGFTPAIVSDLGRQETNQTAAERRFKPLSLHIVRVGGVVR